MDIQYKDNALEVKQPESQTAELEAQGMLSGLADIRVFGLPAGQVAGAMAVAGGWDALSGFLSGMIPAGGQWRWVTPAVGAWAMSTKAVSGWVGSGIASTAGVLLLYQAFTESIINPRQMVRNLLGGVSLGQPKSSASLEQGGDGHREPTSIEEYNRMKGIA